MVVRLGPELPIPPPPGDDARMAGPLTRGWPSRQLHFILRAVCGEIFGPHPEGEQTGVASLVVEDGPDGTPKAKFEAMRRWTEGLDDNLHLIILDGTVSLIEPAVCAALSITPEQVRRVPARPDRDGSRHRLHIRTGPTGYRTRTLGRRRAGTKQLAFEQLPPEVADATGLTEVVELRPRAGPAIERMFALAIDRASVIDNLGSEWLLVAPMRLRAAFEAMSAAAGLHPDPEATAWPAGEGDTSMRWAASFVAEHGLEGVVETLAAARAHGTISELHIGHYGAIRGTNRWEHCSTVICLPYQLNRGAGREIARCLDIDGDIDGERYIAGESEAEMQQARDRIRAIRATPEQPKLEIQVGVLPPVGWGWDPYETVEVPDGGPVESFKGRAVRLLAQEIANRHGAVSRAAVLWVVRHWTGYRATYDRPDQPELLDQAAREVAEGLGRGQAMPRMIQRKVRALSGDWTEVEVEGPDGSPWPMRECRPGAAREMVEGLRAVKEGVHNCFGSKPEGGT